MIIAYGKTMVLHPCGHFHALKIVPHTLHCSESADHGDLPIDTQAPMSALRSYLAAGFERMGVSGQHLPDGSGRQRSVKRTHGESDRSVPVVDVSSHEGQ